MLVDIGRVGIQPAPFRRQKIWLEESHADRVRSFEGDKQTSCESLSRAEMGPEFMALEFFKIPSGWPKVGAKQEGVILPIRYGTNQYRLQRSESHTNK
jgi:hypothetical protein